MDYILVEGYHTGMVDAHEHGDAPHDAGPLSFKLVWLSQMAVQTGVEQTDDR